MRRRVGGKKKNQNENKDKQDLEIWSLRPLSRLGSLISRSSQQFFFRSYSFLIFICFVRPFGKSTCYVSHPILAVSSENQAPFSGRPKLIGSSNECSPGWWMYLRSASSFLRKITGGLKISFSSPPPTTHTFSIIMPTGIGYILLLFKNMWKVYMWLIV